MTTTIPADLIAALHPEQRQALQAGAVDATDPQDLRAALLLATGSGARFLLCYRRHPELGWTRDRRAAADRIEASSLRSAMDGAL